MLKEKAKQILENFRRGVCQWGDFDHAIAHRKGELESLFYSRLADNSGDEEDAIEFLSAVIDIKNDISRARRILDGEETPTQEELSNWASDMDVSGEHVISVFAFVPLQNDNKTIGWAIIEQSGVSLDPEFKLVATFESASQMEEYFRVNYYF